MEEITRREFLKVTGLLTGGLIIGSPPFLMGCGYPAAAEIRTDAYLLEKSTVTVMLERVPRLSRTGGSVAITSDANRLHLIIARTGDDKFVVALNECPHREKPLGYNHSKGYFTCISRKSEFRLDGSIVAGPVENSLPIYQSYLDKNKLIINLSSISP